LIPWGVFERKLPALDAGWIPIGVKKIKKRKSGRYGCVAGMYLGDEGV
jgi:hypothetical protein